MKETKYLYPETNMKKPDEYTRWWKSSCLRAAGLNFEPLIFIRRLGSGFFDHEYGNPGELYVQNSSEENIKKLAAAGINLIFTRYFKGFGIKAEKTEMLETKKLIALCHKYGIKVGAYIQFGDIEYETFFKEKPAAQKWIEIGQNGLPNTYHFGMYYRYFVCFNNASFRRFIKSVIKRAVTEAKADTFYMDNFLHAPEPLSCKCKICRKKFVQYLEKKFSSRQERIDLFGFSDLSGIQPPVFDEKGFTLSRKPPENIDIIHDIVIQEWLNFKIETRLSLLTEINHYVKRLNPDVAINFNASMNPLAANGFLWEVRHPLMCQFSDLFMSEEDGNKPEVRKDGVLVSHIHTYKIGQMTGNTVMTRVYTDETALAESMAFNQNSLGIIGQYLGSLINPADLINNNKTVSAYINFHRTYEKYFINTRSIAEIAILRLFSNSSFGSISGKLSAALCEQMLIQYRMPFDLLADEYIDRINNYKIVILPDLECISDTYAEKIFAYVQNGGNIICTGAVGVCNEFNRKRRFPYFSAEFGIPAENVFQKSFCQGTLAYIPRILPEKNITPQTISADNFFLDNSFLALPKNADEILGMVLRANNGKRQVWLDLPDNTLAVELRKQDERLILHIVNYRKEKIYSNVGVLLSCDDEYSAVYSISPVTGMMKLPFSRNNYEIKFSLEQVTAYILIVLEKN